jgi:hypothetical protein
MHDHMADKPYTHQSRVGEAHCLFAQSQQKQGLVQKLTHSMVSKTFQSTTLLLELHDFLEPTKKHTLPVKWHLLHVHIGEERVLHQFLPHYRAMRL